MKNKQVELILKIPAEIEEINSQDIKISFNLKKLIVKKIEVI